jgi:hypothetical protein
VISLAAALHSLQQETKPHTPQLSHTTHIPRTFRISCARAGHQLANCCCSHPFQATQPQPSFSRLYTHTNKRSPHTFCISWMSAMRCLTHGCCSHPVQATHPTPSSPMCTCNQCAREHTSSTPRITLHCLLALPEADVPLHTLALQSMCQTHTHALRTFCISWMSAMRCLASR